MGCHGFFQLKGFPAAEGICTRKGLAAQVSSLKRAGEKRGLGGQAVILREKNEKTAATPWLTRSCGGFVFLLL
jgi:hypothetical protein